MSDILNSTGELAITFANSLDPDETPRLCHDTKRSHVPRVYCTDIVGIHLNTGTPADLLDDHQGLTSLVIANISNRLSTVKVLLESRANVNFCSGQFGTALHIASRQGNLPMANTLPSGGADFSTKEPSHQTCLFSAALSGQLDVLEGLLLNKDHINDTDTNGLTPLHAAISSGHTEAALYLIKHGASVSKTDSRGNLALHYAVKEKNVTAAKALIKAGSNIDHMNTRSESPIHIAIRSGHLQTIWLLTGSGCDLNVCKPDGSGVLHLLISEYDSCDITWFRLILETLLLRGCDLNTLAYNTLETPLYRAIGLHKYDLAEMLMAYGADPNLSSPFDITALQLACRNDNLQMVQMMLHCGINWKRERWLNVVPMSRANESEDASLNLLDMISGWRTKLPSLRNSCRICIRKRYGDKLLWNLKGMDAIPLSAKNYLLLTDIRQKFLVHDSIGDVTKWFSVTDEDMREGRFSLNPKNADLMDDLHA